MFDPLPRPDTVAGTPRKTGVEIEFGGLKEAAAAQVVARTLGGTARQTDRVDWIVEGTRIGTVKVYLDIFLHQKKQSLLRDTVLDAGHDLIPVEIVTEPLDRDGLLALESTIAPLRDAGALGSAAGIFYGFGVHLNVETPGEDAHDIVPILLAWALIEQWSRLMAPINPTRRLLPFSDPYPARLTDALVELGPDAALDRVIATYLKHAASRNYGLDMLPLFAHLYPQEVKARMGADQAVRPTFHFRLPDCLIDEPGWSLDRAWQRWLAVERVACNPEILSELVLAWRVNRDTFALTRPDWADVSGAILKRHAMAGGAA
ncbi:amidoligase family protein [Oceaniglobus indicus]|uniref:amidoligase family protein n=1 Tax=Oceaniglobus indicus TaxID=2047749 RepID=UPI000C1A3388|nr:amidoligase family protein [Oceaniglobus indicus]